MTRKSDNKAYPYARIKAMNELIEFIRSPEWRPPVIDKDLIKMLSIAPSKEYEVIKALQFMGIIDGDGKPTDYFDDLKSNYAETISII